MDRTRSSISSSKSNRSLWGCFRASRYYLGDTEHSKTGDRYPFQMARLQGKNKGSDIIGNLISLMFVVLIGFSSCDTNDIGYSVKPSVISTPWVYQSGNRYVKLDVRYQSLIGVNTEISDTSTWNVYRYQIDRPYSDTSSVRFHLEPLQQPFRYSQLEGTYYGTEGKSDSLVLNWHGNLSPEGTYTFIPSH